MSLLDAMTPFEPIVHPPLNLDLQSRTSSLETDRSPQQLPPQLVDGFYDSAPVKPVAPPAPSRFSPWLISLAYPLGRYGLMPLYFQQIQVTGREHLPTSGPVILAPTHRSRWDALVVPYAAGRDVTGRHLRFMVSADEVMGLQGWLIRRLGGFPIDTRRPAIASLRHGVELLQQSETLVIFPEGNIFRERSVQPLKPGLARLALQAESHTTLGVKIVPIAIRYSDPQVRARTSATVAIGEPLQVADYRQGSCKRSAQRLTADLHTALSELL